jgi:hypothetical protein
METASMRTLVALQEEDREEEQRMRFGTSAGAMMLLVLLGMPSLAAADGYQRVYSARTQQYVYVPNDRYDYESQPTLRPAYPNPAPPHKNLEAKIKDGLRDIWHSPSVRGGALGAGAGVGVAALTERNLLRGGLIGAGVGLGVGAMDESYYFKRHPLVRRTGKGALIGLGAAAATSAAALLPAAAVGAGIGAGVHYLKTH